MCDEVVLTKKISWLGGPKSLKTKKIYQLILMILNSSFEYICIHGL